VPDEKPYRHVDRIAELVALLARVLAVADRGNYRDGAGLGLHAHPVMDDIREALNPSDE